MQIRKYILTFIISAFSFFLKGQKTDSVFKKQVIHKTDIEILYSHYAQNGNHSAVTGGEGTEKLTVYAPAVKLLRSFGERHILAISAGADVISSPSTDRIDFRVSSASIKDTRSYANANYAFEMPSIDLQLNAGTGFSIESDYFSVPVRLGLNTESKNKMQTYSLDYELYYDDLRWGV